MPQFIFSWKYKDIFSLIQHCLPSESIPQISHIFCDTQVLRAAYKNPYS